MKDYAVDLLTRMVETYSPTGREEPLASLLVEEMKGLGFEVERDAVGNVIGTFEGGRPKVLLCGHMDTVPPQLPVKKEDGILYGRGTVETIYIITEHVSIEVTAKIHRLCSEESIDVLKVYLRRTPDDRLVRLLLGKLLMQQQQFDGAVEQLRFLVEAFPSDVEGWSLLGVAYSQLRKHESAVDAFEAALKLAPVDPSLVRALASALSALKQYGEAADRLRETFSKHPRAVLVGNDLAWLLATCPEGSVRNGTEALEIARRVTDNSQARAPSTLDTLAAAYAELARFDEAVRTMQEVIRLATEANTHPARLAEYQQRLELYRSGSPYRSGGE